LTPSPRAYYDGGMETIIFKAPGGTRAKLRRINPNVSALLREQVEKLIERTGSGSAHEKAGDLCGVFKSGVRDASISKDYLKRYATEGAD